MEREKEVVIEDVAPPYLSQHNVVPAGWNYLPDEKPYHSMAFLMPPPYHSTKQLLLTSAKIQNNNNDELMINKNYPSTIKDKEQSQFDDFGFDLQSVVSMEILENQDQYKSTLKRYPKQQLTTFVEAKNQEVMRRVVEMQRMVENSQRYLNENGELIEDYDEDNNKFNTNNNIKNILRETSVDADSDTESLNSSKQSSNEDAPNSIPPPGILKHSDSLTLLAETINQDLNGINKGLNNMFKPYNGDSELQTNSTSASTSTTNTPKSQRRVHGLSQIINDLQALGNDLSQSESDSESLYTPNSSPIRRNYVNGENPNSIINGHENNNLQPNFNKIQPQKSMKQIRTSFGLHSPDALGDTKDTNLKEYLRQLKEASNNDNGDDQDLAAKKIAELYGFELGDDSMIETDPDLIDLTTIPPPQTPDELDIPPVINPPPTGFGDSSKKDEAKSEGGAGDLEEFLKKVTIEPPTNIVTPAVELTPEEIMSFIIPPPPASDIKAPFNVVKNIDNSKCNNYTPQFPLELSAQSLKEIRQPFFAPQPVPKSRHVDNCNSFYDNHPNNCCNDFYNNSQNIQTGSPKVSGNSVKSKIDIFNNHSNNNSNCSTPTHQPKNHIIEYPTVERKGPWKCCSKDSKSNQDTKTNGCSNLINGIEAISSSDETDNNKQFRLPPRRCPYNNNNQSGSPGPERPPKSADLKLKLNSPVRIMHNFNNYSLYNNTDNNYTASHSNPPSLPPRINSPEIVKKPPLPPVPIKPFHYVASTTHSSPVTSPPPFSTIPRSPNPILKNHTCCNNSSGGSNQSSPSKPNPMSSPHMIQRNQFMNRDLNYVANGGFFPSSSPPMSYGGTLQKPNGHQRANSDCPPVCLKNPTIEQRSQLSLLCSPQMPRKPACSHLHQMTQQQSSSVPNSPLLSNKNGHVINVESLLAKTNVAMSGLLIKLDQVAVQCTNAQHAGGGTDIDEDKFQATKNELTEQSLHLVTASKLLVIAMSDSTAKNLPEHLTSCLTALRRITELAQNLVRYTSAPLQTRNVVLKIHDVASSFRELACVQMGPAGAAQLALSANCLANVLSTLLRSLRVFSP